MNAIYINLQDPSWWFTGLFFLGLALIIPRVWRWIASRIKGFGQAVKLQRLRKIKRIRFDNTKVLVEATKASSWLGIFTISVFLFFYGYLTQPPLAVEASSEGHHTSAVMLFLFFPVLVVEIVAITQRDFFKSLMESRDRLRITRHSS